MSSAQVQITHDTRNLKERSKADPNTLFPTGHCFDDAMEYLTWVVKRDGKKSLENLVIVHGVIHIEGYPLVHGWAENAEHVIEGKYLRGEMSYAYLVKQDFYTELKVKDFVKYKPREALALNYQTGHLGPWLLRYRQMIRNEK